MTTEAVRTEVLHDTVVEQVYIRTADTLICRDTIRIILDAEGQELNRETVREREHLRGQTVAAQKSAHHEEQHSETTVSEDKQTAPTPPSSTPGHNLWPRIKAFLWGVLAGVFITFIIVLRRISKSTLWREL